MLQGNGALRPTLPPSSATRRISLMNSENMSFSLNVDDLFREGKAHEERKCSAIVT